MINVEIYYDFLVEKFGRIDIKGVKYIASMCNLDIDAGDFNYTDAYKSVGEKYGIGSASVERSIRYYIETIIKEKGLNTVCSILRYNIQDDKTTLKVSEFVPLLKLRVNQHLTEMETDNSEPNQEETSDDF